MIETSRDSEAEAASAGGKEDMVDPGIELFVEFMRDRFNSSHPVRTHGVGAHFKRPAGIAAKLFKATRRRPARRR